MKNIRPVTLEGMDKLGVDETDNSLYWNNEKVKIEKRFRLGFWQGFLAFLVAIGTLLSGIGTMISALHAP